MQFNSPPIQNNLNNPILSITEGSFENQNILTVTFQVNSFGAAFGFTS